jgi:uncharacterized protein YfaQ (DUF2300 family)
MHHRRTTVAAATVFAIGAAFAAQPTSLRADWGKGFAQQRMAWTPGTARATSAHDSYGTPLTPPR